MKIQTISKSVRLPATLNKQLVRWSQKMKRQQSEIIRECLSRYLDTQSGSQAGKSGADAVNEPGNAAPVTKGATR